MKKLNILLVPSSSGMAITAIKALKAGEINVVSTDIDPLAPGLYLSDTGYLIPPFDSSKFFDKIYEIVEKESIDLVIPAYDTILKKFSERKDTFRKMGSQVLISSPEVIDICRDKWTTYKKLKGKIPLPDSFIDLNHDLSFPLFIKPRKGSGSEDSYKVDSEQELEFFYSKIDSPLIQNFLPKTEYTIDCLSDKKGKIVASVPRVRIETKAGISTKGKTVKNPKLEEMAETVAKELKIKGPFLCQAKEDENGISKLTEINPRIGGTMCPDFTDPNLHVCAAKLFTGKSIDKPKIKYGRTVTRFWQEIYLEREGKKDQQVKRV